MRTGRIPSRGVADDVDPVTAPIPVPRAPARPEVMTWLGPLAQPSRGRWRARVRVTAVALIASTAVVSAVAAVVVVTAAVTATPAVGPYVPASPGQPAAPVAASGPVSEGGAACPSSGELLSVFRRDEPGYGTNARATGPVACADRFAAMTLRSPTTPDGLRTLFAVGPPVRFLAAGTGPICSDDGGTGSVVVPSSAAETLGCGTGGQAEVARGGASDGADSGASAGDPYGCLAADRRMEDGEISYAEHPCSSHFQNTDDPSEMLPDTPATRWALCHEPARSDDPEYIVLGRERYCR